MRHAQWHFARAVSAENPLEPPGSLHICKVDPREGPVHMVRRLHSAPLVWIEVLKLLSRGEWRRQRERSSYLSRGEARLRGRGKNRDQGPRAPGFFPPAIGAPERAATERSRLQDAIKRLRSASSAASGTPTTRLLPFPEILPRGRRTFYTPARL